MFRVASMAVGLALASLSTTAIAQNQQNAARIACKDDRMKLCLDASGDAIPRCLISKTEQLSQECRKALEPYKPNDAWQGVRPQSGEQGQKGSR